MKKILIDLKNISKSYDGQMVLDDLNLYIRENEFLTLLGPSGCGKTTTLRIMGGFEVPDRGRVLFDGREITSLPPNKRQLNTVFQKYALFPHMTIAENIAFGLKIKKKTKAYIEDKIQYALKLVNLEGYGGRMPDSLSGGQQQRIAIARAIVNEPKVLLLDEPLGALDLKLRQDMQYELIRLKNELGITFIYVTHDQEEALTMSDKIVVMSEGRIQQVGEPEDIYNEPKNAFVADFIGESNIFNGIMTGKYRVRFCGAEFTCVDDVENGTMIDAVLRPEDIQITPPGEGTIQGEVTSVVFKGVHYEITVQSGKNEIVIQSTRKAQVGSRVGLTVDPEGIHIMIAENTVNKFEVSVKSGCRLDFLDGAFDFDITKLIPGSRMTEGEILVDAHGDEVDVSALHVIVSIKPEDISMSDDEEAGVVKGHIINLIYKGDHYRYIVRTDDDEDFIVRDEYLWNMDDYVSLIIPRDKLQYALKK